MSVISQGSFATGAVPAVKKFFRRNGLEQLESRFDWVDSVEALREIEATDPSLADVTPELRQRFLSAVSGATVASRGDPPLVPPISDEPPFSVNSHMHDDYENQEAIRLATAGVTAGVINEDDAEHEYENQEAIELHTIDAHQTWMHGPLDRATSEARLLGARNASGTFLVRMKGSTGRLFAFSIVLDISRKIVKHNLIQFRNDNTVLIDNKVLSRPCASLKSAVEVLKKVHEPRVVPAGPCVGLTDYLLHELQENEKRWKRLSCSRTQAEHLLSAQLPGVFYIRSRSKGGLCFSVRVHGNRMYNGQIIQTLEGYQVGKTTLCAPTLPELARAMMVDHSAVRKCGVEVRLQLSDPSR